MSDIKEKLTADEQAYLDKMKASLRELGVSLTSGVDIHEQARVINNRAFALAAGAMPVDDPAQKLTAAQAYIAKMEEALLVFGLNPQNETIDLRDCARAYARGRADEQAMLDTAQARVKELEEKLDEWKLGAHTFATRAERLEAEVAKLSSAGIKVEPATDPAHAELAQIWELWGAGPQMTPGCVYEAAREEEGRSTKLDSKLRQIGELLDAAGLPRNYQPAQTGGRVSVVERVKLLIGQRDEATNTAHNAESAWTIINEDMGAAISELDGLGAPTFAGHVQLDISARIRALPGLLRQE